MSWLKELLSGIVQTKSSTIFYHVPQTTVEREIPGYYLRSEIRFGCRIVEVLTITSGHNGKGLYNIAILRSVWRIRDDQMMRYEEYYAKVRYDPLSRLLVRTDTGLKYALIPEEGLLLTEAATYQKSPDFHLQF